MIALKKIMEGGKKKRLTGIATTQEAQRAFDEYYNSEENYSSKQRGYLGKIFDMQYQKDEKNTLKTCDAPEFLKCREKSPNKDGKGDTCLDVAETVCDPDTRGSAKYTRTKRGPKRFDVRGVDSFPEGEEFEVDGRKYTSKGIPKGKTGILNKDDAKKRYKARRKAGEKDIVNYKKKGKTCKSYRKTKSPKCEDHTECKWVKTIGCRKKKQTEKIREERKVLREELEISDDEEEEIDGDAEELLCFERSELDGIRNIDKLDAIARKETICVYFEDDKILVILYDQDEDTVRTVGVLNPLVQVDMNELRNLDVLEGYIRDNTKSLEYIARSKMGGGSDLRVRLYVNTNNGDILYEQQIVGTFKNGLVTLF